MMMIYDDDDDDDDHDEVFTICLWLQPMDSEMAPTYGLIDGVLTMSSNSKKLVQQHHLVSNLKFALHEGIQNCTRTLTELNQVEAQ